MSVFNLDKNFIFIHVPRTAGTSMEQAPFMQGIHGHIPWIQYDLVLGKGTIGVDLENVFSFAFVRDPLQRFLSAFEYGKIRGKLRKDQTIDGICKVMDDTKPMEVIIGDLEGQQGVVRDLPHGPLFDGMLFNLFMPQAYYLVNDKMEIGVKYIGKFENLKKDWNFVCDQISVRRYGLPHLKKIDEKPKPTKAIKRSVERFYKIDYDAFYA